MWCCDLCFSSGFLLGRRLFLAFCLCFRLGLRESKEIRDNVSACACACACACVHVCAFVCVCTNKHIRVQTLYKRRAFTRKISAEGCTLLTRASARVYACVRARKDRTHGPHHIISGHADPAADPTTRTVYTLEGATYHRVLRVLLGVHGIRRCRLGGLRGLTCLGDRGSTPHASGDQ